MELLQLRYFCDAAKTENFSTTAKRFAVPPSAVSQSIRRLETELGARLFTRRANTVSLNATGAEFYEKAHAALSLLTEAADAVLSPERGKINMCINVSRGRFLPVLEAFRQQYPTVELHVKHLVDPSAESFDIVIADQSAHLAGYNKTLLASEQLAIAIHKSNPLAAEENLTVSMLQNEPFVLMNEQSSMHATVLSVCADFGFRPRIALQSDDPGYLVRLVNLGMGVAIVPLFLSSAFSEESVVRLPLAGYARDIYICTPKDKRITKHAEVLLEMLTQACAK